MTSRELCHRAITFRRPERLPMSYPSFGVCDLGVFAYTAPKEWRPSRPGQDEWGAVWRKTEVENMGQMVEHPIQDWGQLAEYVFPDPDAPSRFDRMETQLAEQPDMYAVAIAETVLTLWERYYSLRGFSQALTDICLYPSQMHSLLERILDFHIRIVRNLSQRFRGRIDAFFVSDDWGTETTTLVAPPVWREFFKDRYHRLCDAIHDGGMHAILHTDGRINDLIPDFIDVGFDALNLHSPTVVGIEEVGLAFAGRMAFLPCIDIQHTYVSGTVEDVRREARLLLEYWGTRDGGVIPTEYDRSAVGAPPENVEAAYRAFAELDMKQCGAAYRGAERII